MTQTAYANWEISGADYDSLPASGQFAEIVGDTEFYADDDGDLFERHTSLADFAEIMAGDDEAVQRSVAATKRVIAQASAERHPPPPMRVVPLDEDHDDDVQSAAVSDAFDDLVILGDDADEAFPTLRRLYDKFSGGADPKFVRMDTEETYCGFRRDQSAEMAELRAKVAQLDQLIHAHMADGHGAQDRIEGLAAIDPRARGLMTDISYLQDAADPETKRIPLMLPPWAEGKVDCWREGDAICCSIRIPGPDGQPRVITSATPVSKHVEKACGYVVRSGVDPVDMLGVLPTLVCMFGAETIPQMAASVPALLALPEATNRQPFVGHMVPANNPPVASLIALMHLCQHGDAQACAELVRLRELAETAEGAPLAGALHDAAQRLAAA